MLVEAIPSIWTSLLSWFTPAVLFVLLNLVIGTIAFTSKGSSSSIGDRHSRTGALVRTPSFVLDQIRSLSFSRYAHHEIPTETGHLQSENVNAGGLGGISLTRAPSLVFDRLRSFNLTRFVSGEYQAESGEVEPATDMVPGSASQAQVEEHEHHNEHHIERSQSDARSPVPKLPVRMKKSASSKSMFSHFKEAEIPKQQTLVEVDDDGEVDAKADDFINKFRNQLKLQRLNSIIRYKEMLTRGAAN